MVKEKMTKVPMEERWRDITLVTSLKAHVNDPAIIKMCNIANENWDRISCFANDFVSLYSRLSLIQENQIDIPNLQDKKIWMKLIEKAICLPKVVAGENNEMWDLENNHVDNTLYENFQHHDFNITFGYHINFIEYMAQLEAIAIKNYNSYVTLHKHVTTYIRGVYGIRLMGWAKFIAYRILASDPLDYDHMPDKLVEEYEEFGGADYIDGIISYEAEMKDNCFHWQYYSQGCLKYRFFMLRHLDIVHLENQNNPDADYEIKRFTLLPSHSCGSSRFAVLDKSIMDSLIPQIKDSHSVYYANTLNARKLHRSSPDGFGYNLPLSYFFDYPEKKGWCEGREVRVNGVEIHFLYEKNKIYGQRGVPLKSKAMKKYKIDETKDWNLPKQPIQGAETIFAGVDKGHHNFYHSARFTGQVDNNGERVFETRNVKKTWFDNSSGRKKMRRMAAKLTKRAQSNNLLQPLTEAHFKTADLESIYRAIGARRDAYFSLYKIKNNRKIKKFKFACR